ncbi:hypothetical protein QTH87_07740 [Variovorax sp. J22P168]|uniref:hypothetical protein n=1 Tax=Variovorax jilinensis TaxID=3053513 RepID=UPI002576395A|nr:hypothetical protein [Variovorax sp. J22P168]MDM0012325.1 hypothetical protein [Variovorax sp. J22P168]
MNDPDRALCTATAGLLRASAAVAAWGLALSCISLLVLALTGRSLPASSWAAFAVVALAGLLERHAAFRLRQEAAMYAALAQGAIATLPALDAALVSLGLRPGGAPPVALPERVRATRQLLQRQGFTVAVQTIAFALALALQ